MAPPGRLLLAADYSQQELRILAHVSGDAGLKADFASHSDIHLAAAARVLGLAPEQVGPRERSVAFQIANWYGSACQTYSVNSEAMIEKIPKMMKTATMTLNIFG